MPSESRSSKHGNLHVWMSKKWVRDYSFSILVLGWKKQRAIGRKLGVVVEVTPSLDKLATGKRLRVKVRVNVTKPLKQGCWMSLADGRRRQVMFKIEKLLDCRFVCGCLNHLDQDCEKAVELWMANKEVIKNFDSSLRADGLGVASSKTSYSGGSQSIARSFVRANPMHDLMLIPNEKKVQKVLLSEEVGESHPRKVDELSPVIADQNQLKRGQGNHIESRSFLESTKEGGTNDLELLKEAGLQDQVKESDLGLRVNNDSDPSGLEPVIERAIKEKQNPEIMG
ncbi:hypothetical protein PTKIN_Ptkin04bG0127200 [Pterospermum kingtungense]